MPKVIQLTSQQEEILARVERVIRRLSDAEIQVATLAASGLSAKQIAAHLGTTQKKVERYIESITTKARYVYGNQATFRGIIATEIYCFYFIQEASSELLRQPFFWTQ